MKDGPTTSRPQRYVSIHRSPQQWDSDYGETPLTMTVIDDDVAPQKTGLLDSNGTPIYRVNERAPIGFRARGVPHD